MSGGLTTIDPPVPGDPPVPTMMLPPWPPAPEGDIVVSNLEALVGELQATK